MICIIGYIRVGRSDQQSTSSERKEQQPEKHTITVETKTQTPTLPHSSYNMGTDETTTSKGVPPTGSSGNPVAPPSYNYYGTFQGVPTHPPPSHPVIGFPQPTPPPNLSAHAPPHYYPHGYQTVTGYAVVEGRPYSHNRHDRLPCCGMGVGWFLFISGFFLGAIPWYIGACLLLFVRLEYREKPGLIACTLAAILALIAVMLGVTRLTHGW